MFGIGDMQCTFLILNPSGIISHLTFKYDLSRTACQNQTTMHIITMKQRRKLYGTDGRGLIVTWLVILQNYKFIT